MQCVPVTIERCPRHSKKEPSHSGHVQTSSTSRVTVVTKSSVKLEVQESVVRDVLSALRITVFRAVVPSLYFVASKFSVRYFLLIGWYLLGSKQAN